MERSPLATIFQSKIVRGFLIFDAIIVIAIVVLFVIRLNKTAVLTLNIVPTNSRITIDGKRYENGSYPFAPGAHKVEISHDDLDTKTFNIALEPNHNLTIATFLKRGEDNFTFYTLRDNLDSFYNLEQIASTKDNYTYDHDASAEAFIANYRSAIDLYQNALPIEYQEYNDDLEDPSVIVDITIKQNFNENECKTYLCLKAFMLGTDDKVFTNALLTDAGFNLEDYEISYNLY